MIEPTNSPMYMAVERKVPMSPTVRQNQILSYMQRGHGRTNAGVPMSVEVCPVCGDMKSSGGKENDIPALFHYFQHIPSIIM